MLIIAAALDIQQLTAVLLVNKMNELAVRLRENRTEIDICYVSFLSSESRFN